MITALLILTILILIAAMPIISRLARGVLNPYALIISVFIFEVFLLLLDPFTTKPVPGAVPSLRLAWVTLGAMVSLIIGGILGLRGIPPKPTSNATRLSGVPLITIGCCLASLFTLADMTRKAGGFPLLIMGQSFSAGTGTTYADYFTSLFMYGLGICRVPAIVLAVDFVGSGQRFQDHLKANAPWYGATLLTSAIMVLGGQRNCLFWPFVCWGGAYLVTNPKAARSAFQALLGMLFLGWVFTFIGSLRFGTSSAASTALFSYYDADIPDNSLTRSVIWLPTYVGPSLYNFNAALLSPYEPTMGRTLALRTLPDSWLPDSFSESEYLVEYLFAEDLMPMFGQTFRTAMADFYGEFGIPGAIIVPGLLLWLSTRAYRNARTSVRWCYLYIATLPGIVMMPFIDFFTGSTNLIPLASAFIIPVFFHANAKPVAGRHPGLQRQPEALLPERHAARP
jgi:oligosaccharide repeat unit polymerase